MALAPQLVLFAAAAALLSSLLLAATAAGQKAGLPGCPTSCGGVSVPFPFGISPGCYLPGFNLTCDPSSAPSRLVLGNGTLQVSDISLHNSTVRVLAPDIHMDLPKLPLSNGGVASGTWGGQGWGLGDGGPYLLSSAHNEFIVTGCHFVAELTAGGGYIINGCSSTCTREAESDPRQRDQFRPQGDGGRRRCKTCTGIGCCQAPIPYGHTSYDVTLRLLNDDRLATIVNQNNFSVHIAEEGWFDGNTTTSGNLLPAVPAVLAWVIRSSVLQGTNETRDGDQTCPTDLGTGTCHSGNSSCTTVREEYTTRARGYTCKCWDGYEGNPYLPDGCQDIDECALPGKCYGTCTNTPGNYSCECPDATNGNPNVPNGCVKSHAAHIGLILGLVIGSVGVLLFLVLGNTFLIHKVKAQRKRRQRHRFFKQNRGQLLQQLISQRADIAERMIIDLEEIEKATNYFDRARELGGGGHGTVYKGILSSLHVVAIKRSKIVIQREINEFINEVAILSQINHTNIVKLHGCCLETEVPLLVYEFISNGTLYNHLHIETSVSLPWRDRLRIAVEVARALSYLHSFVSMPIIHRDIKSPNILLDDNLTVKLSDFGASRYIPVTESSVHTAVQGTLGYLDPMYHSTGHLTKKSDVYSFGVLLIELLTRKKPVSYRSCQGYSLVVHFVTLLTESNGLHHILDPQLLTEGGGEVVDVALLAAICVKFIGEERPTMRQVEMALEGIHAAKEYVSSNTDDESE